jgi:CRISPR-associated endonuclease/helicase Cas3
MVTADKKFIAHAKQDSSGTWLEAHLLDDHLRSVAKIAGELASKFGSQGWGRMSGQWHDLGKYQDTFQDYIRDKTGYEKENAHIEQGYNRVTHSTAGAIHAIETFGPVMGHIIAYLISGHHAGLPDWDGGRGSLKFRLEQGKDEYQSSLCNQIPSDILAGEQLTLPVQTNSSQTIALWIRMLFSCLVDADFLDTEAYMSPEKFVSRPRSEPLQKLQSALLSAFEARARETTKSELNSTRTKIRQMCIDAAQRQPGMFSLTVPTGGGKTLSSLAFALQHAVIFDKRRIIYAIPFTSIIEQTAKVFSDILGPHFVLEHHSNLDIDERKETGKNRLASENWDFPLIVTTNVQLFESLFASRTSKCRKLHNLVNSVIILDEAQQLPRDFHKPITEAMNQLSEHFGVTWVLCTATQPVLGEEKDALGRVLLQGVKNVREIVSDPSSLAKKLKRVQVIMPNPNDKPISWVELSDQLSEEPCVLAIVNSRSDARRLNDLLHDKENNLHLSANMCAEHRSLVLQEIRARLKARSNGDSRPLRVVSTQLIEAGVDVDFPVVYRAIAGLDSIAQSAGRCNREEKLDTLGKVIVFIPETAVPIGFLRQGAETTISLLRGNLIKDPLSPESLTLFFTHMNAKGNRDKHGICELLTAAKPRLDAPLSLAFRSAAEKFRLIDDTGVSLIAPFKNSDQSETPIEIWLSMLDKDSNAKWIYRKLQRYSITVPENLARKLEAIGVVYTKAGLRVIEDSYYHPVWGLKSPQKLATAEESVL